MKAEFMKLSRLLFLLIGVLSVLASYLSYTFYIISVPCGVYTYNTNWLNDSLTFGIGKAAAFGCAHNEGQQSLALIANPSFIPLFWIGVILVLIAAVNKNEEFLAISKAIVTFPIEDKLATLGILVILLSPPLAVWLVQTTLISFPSLATAINQSNANNIDRILACLEPCPTHGELVASDAAIALGFCGVVIGFVLLAKGMQTVEKKRRRGIYIITSALLSTPVTISIIWITFLLTDIPLTSWGWPSTLLAPAYITSLVLGVVLFLARKLFRSKSERRWTLALCLLAFGATGIVAIVVAQQLLCIYTTTPWLYPNFAFCHS